MSKPSSSPQPEPSRRRAFRKTQLSPARQWLVESMQSLGHGQIKRLVVSDHQPVVNPPPRICPRRKLVGPPQQTREIPQGDFILKEQVVNLFDALDSMSGGVITIEVRDGLPFDIIYE